MIIIELELGSIIPIEGKTTFTTVMFMLSNIGIALSLLCLLLLLITSACLREWRQSYKNQLLVQLMLARFLYTFTRFIFDIRTIYEFCDSNSCIIYLDKIMMIYTELLLVVWTFIFTKQMYQSLVVVLNVHTPNIWKVSVITWIGPLVGTVLLRLIYMSQTDNDLRFFCLYLAVIKWPLLVANAVILIMILVSLTKPDKTRSSNSNNSCRTVFVMNMMIFFFCFQQIFVDVYKLVYIVFNLSNYWLIVFNLWTTYHCSVAIIFWVFGNSNTRKLWKSQILSRKKTPLSPTISLDSNCTTISSLSIIK